MIISKCALKCSNQDIEQVIHTPMVEGFILSHLKKRNIKSTKHCLSALGQFIAVVESRDLGLEYIKEAALLEDLQWALLAGNSNVRSEALWILSNLACSPESAVLIAESPANICSNILLEVKKRSILSKKESLLVLANLVKNLSHRRDLV